MIKTINTFCGICESACGMKVTTEGNRVSKIEGLHEHVRTKGYLCVKGKSALDIMYSPHRLKYPLKKKNNVWERISWEEAFEIIAEKLTELKKTYGANSLSVYHGQSYVKDCLAMFCMKRFLNAFGTVNLCSAASECFVPRIISGVTTFGALPAADASDSNCIIFWGSNPFASGIMFGLNMPGSIKEFTHLKEQGVKFIVIDPMVSGIAKLADLHIKIRPGTDGALALGMIRVIIENQLYDKEYIDNYTSGFDQLKGMVRKYELKQIEETTKVPRELINKAARMFAQNNPASIVPGVGLEHHTNAVQTLRSLAVLSTITGNIDRAGGNTMICPFQLASATIEDAPRQSQPPIGSHEHPLFVKMMNQAHALVIIDEILKNKESPTKALIVAGGAPVPQLANTNKVREALKKIDFIVVIDFFMTETAQYADLVLPAAFFLERDEVFSYPLSLQNKVVKPEGCMSDSWFWCELAKKMGFEKYFPWKSSEEIIDFVLKPTGFSYQTLKEHPEGIMNKLPPGKFLKNGFNTPTKKIEIYSNILKSMGYDPLPEYKEPFESVVSTPELAQQFPITLITGARLPMYLHSQFRNIDSLKKLHPEPFMELHPQTAHDYGIDDNDLVRVESKRGKVVIKTKLTESILPQVAHIPHGWVEKDCNILTDHENRDPISGFPGLNSSLCRITKI